MTTRTYSGLLDFARDLPIYFNHFYHQVYMTPEARDILQKAAEQISKMLKPGAPIQVMTTADLPKDMVIFVPGNRPWTPENIRVVKICGLADPVEVEGQ